MKTPMPLQIGYVLKRYPRYSETFVVSEILAHEAAGLEVHIFSLYPPVDSHFQDAISRVRAPVHYLPGEGSKVPAFWTALGRAQEVLPGLCGAMGEALQADARDVFQAVALALEAQRLRLGHLHAHFATAAASVARLAGKFAQLSYSLTAHAKDIFHVGVQADDLRRKLRDASAVVTVSDFNARHLRQAFGEDAARVRRLYNGLDLDRYPFDSPRVRPSLVVAVGRLVEKKGFDVLIEACARLAQRSRAFRCQIIGEGEQEMVLKAQVAELGLQERVEFSGPLPQTEVARRVQSAAVLAAPCLVGEDGNRDGLPTVLLEAMALGTPCVSTDLTGIPEAVRDGDTGLLVPQRDPAALADALERLFDAPTLREKLAAQARQLIEAEFNVRVNAARLREIFAASASAEA